MSALANPYFLGLLVLVLILMRFGSMLRDMHRERRKRAASASRRGAETDVEV